MDVLALQRELIGDVNQLICDGPGDAASDRDRNQDGRDNGHYAPDAQPLEKSHYRSQQKGQSERKGEGD
jgi:hypothetical protein